MIQFDSFMQAEGVPIYQQIIRYVKQGSSGISDILKSRVPSSGPCDARDCPMPLPRLLAAYAHRVLFGPAGSDVVSLRMVRPRS